ncbi:MAG TPA: TerB family tellurite resistance protein [Polyangia bacterium]
MKERIHLVADLLLGAAHADGRLEGNEQGTVKRLLREILGTTTLPIDLEFRLEDFDPKSLDFEHIGRAFAGDSLIEKRRLLELVASVHAGGDEVDLVEDAYVRKVGAAIGIDEAHFRDLAAAIIEDRALGLSREMPALRPGNAKPPGR